ncbi:methyltransferase [Lithospermum erythrorhizon]|uniref:Methyltransferase n=1 Tax=Lithospermum erythrorhizon TaxID=34254 RepID=A0AAV3P8F7_LITER
MGGRTTSVLHMKGGNDESSYAKNSSIQEKVIVMTKPIRTRAIDDLFSNNPSSRTICIADLGCSSGPTSLLVTSELVETISRTRRRLALESQEIQVFLNDLPGNDFNTVFRLLQEKDNHDVPRCYYNGVPGSFYNRLFPIESLHFVHSSYSLHWLSQVPEGLENNKESIYLSSKCPSSVKEAYHKQFHNDFSMFLKHRAVELVPGGGMVLTMQGRTSTEIGNDGCVTNYELLAEAISDMVSEGHIQEQELHSFNIPYYNPTPNEISTLIQEEGSFIIDHLEPLELDWTDYNVYETPLDKNDGFFVMKSMRSAIEPMLLHHFDEGILDDMFSRYQNKIANCMAKEIPGVTHIIISLKKKTMESSASIQDH